MYNANQPVFLSVFQQVIINLRIFKYTIKYLYFIKFILPACYDIYVYKPINIDMCFLFLHISF